MRTTLAPFTVTALLAATLLASSAPARAALVDSDGDRVDDEHDVCIDIADPTQADADGDGFGDACDACVGPGAGGVGLAPEVDLVGLPETQTVKHAVAADLDGDGDLDLAATLGTGEIAWTENRGADGFDTYRLIDTQIASLAEITAADIDGDGDVDLAVAAQAADAVLWYENLGGRQFGPPQAIDAAIDAPSALAAADLDGDGDIDLAVSRGLPAAILWYANDGTGQFAAQADVDAAPGTVDSLAVADLDYDGRPDLVAARSAAGVVAWYPNAGGSFDPAVIAVAVADPRSVAMIDLDGDGALDVAWGSFSLDQAGYALRSGLAPDAGFGPPVVVDDALDGCQGVGAADLDGDGDVDLLGTSYYDGTLVSYEQQPSGAFAAGVIVDDDLKWPRRILTVDVDGDGIVDPISVGATSSADQPELRVHPASGAAFTVPANAWAIDRLALVDVDDDGQRDLLGAVPEGIVRYEPIGDGRFAQRLLVDSPTDTTAVSGADLDGDGDTDLIVSTWADGSVATWENVGGGVFANRVARVVTNGRPDAVAVDVDGDGDLDLVATSEFDDQVNQLENLGGGTFGTPVALGAVDHASQPQAADLDGDGDREVLLASEEQGLLIYDNLGAGLGAPRAITTYGPTDYDLADLDADGDLDVVYVDASGLWTIENTGGGAFGTPRRLNQPYGGLPRFVAFRVAAADVDGDGLIDLVYAMDGGYPYWSDEDQVGVVMNLGGSFGNANRLTGTERRESGPSDLVVGDVDGDGANDIVGAWSQSRAVAWMRNQAGCGVAAPPDTGDTGTASGDTADTGAPPIDTTPPPDSTSTPSTPGDGPPKADPGDEVGGGCGCDGASGDPRALALVGVGLAMIQRRRRRLSGVS